MANFCKLGIAYIDNVGWNKSIEIIFISYKKKKKRTSKYNMTSAIVTWTITDS